MRKGISQNRKTNVVGFNYDSIDDVETRRIVKGRADAINTMLRQTAEHIVAIGRYLHEVKELVPKGLFQGWIYAECQWSRSTACRYMLVAKKFGDLDCLPRFQTHALSELARNSVPEIAIDETIALARSGETVSYTTACAIIRKHSPRLSGPARVAVLDRIRKWVDRIRQDLSETDAKVVADELERQAQRLREIVALESNGSGRNTGANCKPVAVA